MLAVVLSIVAGLVWFSALQQTGAGCPRPTADQLDAVTPAPPQLTQVQVLNANGVPGLAAGAGAALAQLGFATAVPANDPRYPAFNLHCYGEIRFGAAGQAGARTLSLAVPCAELVRDLRPDARIDLALGTKFVALRPTEAARTALMGPTGLGPTGLGPAVPAASSSGGLPAAPLGPQVVTELASPVPVVTVPAVNRDLLHRARQVKC